MTSAGQHARTYVHALLGGHGALLDGLKVTLDTFGRSRPEPSTRWLPAQPDVVLGSIGAAVRDTGLVGVHLGVGLSRGARGLKPNGRPYSRLAEPIVDGIAWLFADLDVQGAVHGDKRTYPPTKDAAVAVARCTGLVPTVLVDTGHGIQAYWVLDEPLIFGWTGDVDDDGHPVIDQSRVAADRARAAKLTRDWFNSLRIRADREHGYFFDPIGDMARLLRVPGTTNRKLVDDQRPVLVLDADSARRYDLDQIEAVLAPEETLRTYRFSAEAAELDVDLPAAWARAKTYPAHTPPWLNDMIESGLSGDLERIWSGKADAEHHHNDSDIDWALGDWCFRNGLSAADACEAIMCLRLRTGRKLEKVNPACRVSYLERTVGKLLAAHRERQGEPEPVEQSYDERAEQVARVYEQITGTAAAEASSSPVAVLERVTEGPAPETAASDPPAKPAPPRGSLRAADPLPDPYVEHADAPRAPRLGMDSSTPAPPDATEELGCAQLTGMLGLPDGVRVWAVGMRRLVDRDEVRIWCVRDEFAEVHGGNWRPGTVKGTFWHSKDEFDAKARVEDLLFHDLHVSASPAREWRSQGRPLMYRLARRITEGTPAEMVRLALVELLCAGDGSALLSRARATGDPWVTTSGSDIEIWVALGAIRERLSRNYTPMKPMALMDTLEELGCKLRDGLSSVEPHGPVSDHRQWIRMTDDLDTGGLWDDVMRRAVERDAQERRSEMRTVGGTS